MSFEIKTNIYGQPSPAVMNQSSLASTNAKRFAKLNSSPGVSELFGGREPAISSSATAQPPACNALNTK